VAADPGPHRHTEDLRNEARAIVRQFDGWERGRAHLRRLAEIARELGDHKLGTAVTILMEWR
jgi:hypothetical protein